MDSFAAGLGRRGEGPSLLDFPLNVVFWSWFTFVLLLLALWRTAWPKIVKALDEREARIQKRFDDAEERVAAAEDKVAEYEERLRRIEDESRRVLDKARQDAERLSVEIQARGRSEIDRLLTRAKREVGLARGKAADELKNEVVDMVLKIVERVLEEEVGDLEHRRFVERCIAGYEDAKP